MLARQAITQTPLKLRSTSVPSTGKFFKVEDVNQDLVVELRGATIEEGSLNSPSHYILDLIAVISPHTTQNIPLDGDPLKIASLLLKSEILYRDGYWEPTNIPKILRSTAHNRSFTSIPNRGRSTRMTNSSRAQRSCPSPQQSSSGIRTETLHRHIPGTSQEESVQGTFIPLVGSEEQQVATWFNKITSALEPFIPPVPASSDKVLTCSVMAISLCSWSSETSRKLVKDALMAWKPDIIIQEKLAPGVHGPQPEFSWSSIIFFIKLTSTPYSSSDSSGTICATVTWKAYTTFVSQPN